jgi:predicted alpha/beta-fold hydrolase
MGANICGNYMGEEGENNYVSASCLVQPPMRQWLACEKLERSLFGFYSFMLSASLKTKVKANLGVIKDHYMSTLGLDIEKESELVKKVSDFDDRITSKIFGYTSRHDYY